MVEYKQGGFCVKHLGDITKIKNASFVDCITFGSPCQNLSIAGKREGLAGEQSGLFIEAVRIIKEMREQSGGLYPTFAVWENVPGAFSSNSGEDFRIVLEELARIEQSNISIPRPENGKWAKAGFIAGNEWSIAWRTFDAKFWGVPQRRRRIAVVVDFGGQRAGEILFERTGVSGNPEPSIPPWKGIARDPSHRVAGHARVVEGAGAYTLKIRSGCEGGGKGPLVQTEKSATLSTLQNQTLFEAIPINDKATRWMGGGKSRNHDGSGNGLGVGDETDPMFTLTAGDRHAVCCIGVDGYNGCETGDKSITIRARKSDQEVFENHSQDARYAHLENTCSTMVARWGTGGNNMPIVTEKKGFSCSGFAKYTETIGTLRASGGDFGGGSENLVTEKHTHWIVRRLTPTECERLQGFPDRYTDIGEWVDSKGKRHKPADSPRYKAIGNSIALPQWWWLTCKMAAYLPEHATLGSLFDGIGGFPLVWETRHGKGTTIWASEIEEFPIAVTKEHFK